MRNFLLSGFILSASFAGAQDVHFSQFYMNPVYLNPALTGSFDGQWRFSYNQRQQWRSVSKGPYNTIGISAENKQGLLLPNLYHAINIFHDNAGDGNYRTTEVGLTTAYHLKLGADSIHSITPGISLQFNHRFIDFSKFSFDNQFNGYYYDESLPNFEVPEASSRANFNCAAGLLYSYKPSAKKMISIGAGVFNITQAKQSFYGDDGIRRDVRFLFNARALWPIKEKWDIQPAIMSQFQGKFMEVIFGTNVRYTWKERRDEYIAPYAGIYFRNKDAFYVVAGAYYNNWIAGVSYDFNVSQLFPASHLRGGIEFSLQYILSIYKPRVIQYRICPDYL